MALSAQPAVQTASAPDHASASSLDDAIDAAVDWAIDDQDPKGFWVGVAAARAVKEGKLALRENHHFGRLVSVHR